MKKGVKRGWDVKPHPLSLKEKERMLLNFDEINNYFKFLELSFRLGRNLSSTQTFLLSGDSEGFPTSGNDKQHKRLCRV
jgi:hypothetical protein